MCNCMNHWRKHAWYPSLHRQTSQKKWNLQWQGERPSCWWMLSDTRLSCGFTSHSTQNTSFQRRSSQPISWLSVKPGLVASYDLRPGNGDGLFWFWHFINLSLTYLDTYPLTYSPGSWNPYEASDIRQQNAATA